MTITTENPPDVSTPKSRHPVLEILDVSKSFPVRDGFKTRSLSAVDHVSLSVDEGTTLGIVGESGCGKSTLARIIVGLHTASNGEIIFDGKQISTTGKRDRAAVEQMQMVFQDPSSALNPPGPRSASRSPSRCGYRVSLPTRSTDASRRSWRTWVCRATTPATTRINSAAGSASA